MPARDAAAARGPGLQYAKNDQLVFHVDGAAKMCCFGCVYAFAQERKAAQDSLYQHSPGLTRKMFEQVYPGDALVASPPWYLRRANGGPLDDEKFFDDTKEYVRDRVVMLPVKQLIVCKERQTREAPV